jgi:hypothetical protein
VSAPEELLALRAKAQSRRGRAESEGERAEKGIGRLNFLNVEVSYFLFLFFVEAGLLNCNPVLRGARNHPHKALWDSDLTSADSGLQLDLVIALSGVPA